MQNPKMLENITQHWSKKQIAAREAAEAELSRDDVNLIMPDYVAANKAAKKCWLSILKATEDIALFDNVDIDILGAYCMIMSRLADLRAVYKANSKLKVFDNENIEAIRKTESLLLQYSGKLGLSPESRARLAKKRAAPESNDPLDDLYGKM